MNLPTGIEETIGGNSQSRSHTFPDRCPTTALDPAVRRADWTLRIAILLFAIGLARAYFTRTGSSVGSIALLEWDISHARILLAEKLAASLILVSAVTVLVRPSVTALAVIAGLVFAESCAAVHTGGAHFTDLTPFANALRFLTPLALALLIPFRGAVIPSPAQCHISAWVLRIGLAVVFLIHGMEAWNLHPQFIDYIIGSGRNLGGYAITESAAGSALKMIAVVDIAVAMLVLFRPWTALLVWMAFWGLITALSRTTSLGFASYPEVLLRASHVIAPIALWQLTAAISRRR